MNMNVSPPPSYPASLSPKGERGKDLHSHLIMWMKRKINRNADRSLFQPGERLVRRRGIDPESKQIKTVSRRTDSLSVYLSREHKVQPSGKSILRLPKLPFGSHQTYNEEEAFTQRHIIDGQASPELHEELDALVRKYRLADKRNKLKGKYSPPRHQSPTKTEFDQYPTDTGLLYCPQHKRIIEAYDNDTLRYRKAIEQSLRVKNEDSAKSKPFPESTHLRGASVSPVLSGTRVYQIKRTDRTSRLSESLTHKYSKLFENEPESTAETSVFLP